MAWGKYVDGRSWSTKLSEEMEVWWAQGFGKLHKRDCQRDYRESFITPVVPAWKVG